MHHVSGFFGVSGLLPGVEGFRVGGFWVYGDAFAYCRACATQPIELDDDDDDGAPSKQPRPKAKPKPKAKAKSSAASKQPKPKAKAKATAQAKAPAKRKEPEMPTLSMTVAGVEHSITSFSKVSSRRPFAAT